MMNSPKNTGPLAACLALAAILSSTAMTPALAQDNLREVVFGLPNVAMTPAFCMFAVSSELDFFAEEGLDVRVQTMSGAGQVAQMLARSEEHTSELQSLMRISYAVFCLKKKHKIQAN